MTNYESLPDSGSILKVFVETKCVICQGRKRKNNAFCPQCYYMLPKQFQSNLWRRFGEGFEEAFIEAFDWLKK